MNNQDVSAVSQAAAKALSITATEGDSPAAGAHQPTEALRKALEIDPAKVNPAAWLERLRHHPQLSGSFGAFRERGRPLAIKAQDDRQAIEAWLGRFDRNPLTRNLAEREALRLHIWSVLEKFKPMSSLTRADLLEYEIFLSNPQPAERWVQPNGSRLPLRHYAWRPFCGPLAPSSVRQAMTTIAAMLNWLTAKGYLSESVLTGRRPAAKVPRAPTRMNSVVAEKALAALEAKPKDSILDTRYYHRQRWLLHLVATCQLSTIELMRTNMGDFSMSHVQTTGVASWYLEVCGKMGRRRRVAVTPKLIDELQVYRRSMGLPGMPTADSPEPLIFPVSRRKDIMPRRADGQEAAPVQCPNRRTLELTMREILELGGSTPGADQSGG